MASRLTAADQEMYLKRALRAADWFVNSQVRVPRPWMADSNRYLYYYYIPEDKYVPGLNWTHGRALFVLTEAYKLTGDRRYMDSMDRAGHYILALQPLDPYYPITYGAFREEIPQAPRGGMLDGAQLASGVLMLYRVGGNRDYLRRGLAFCDYLTRHWSGDLGLPEWAEFWPEAVRYSATSHCIHHATAIPLWDADCITGERRYLPPMVDAADRILACQRPDGAFNYVADTRGHENPPLNHHWGLGSGDQKLIVRNDDGIVTVVLAAYKATGSKKYLEAMVHYADWTIANEPHERPYNAFGIQAANVLDIGAVAGKDYTPWVLDHLESHLLKLQVENTGNLKADGGFRGEDEEGNSGIFGGTALDYVVTRVTCYMSGVLFRLSGKGTGAGFSVFGLKD